MLFAEALLRQLKETMRCLEDFANVSGLGINLDKSKAYFSPNLNDDHVKNWGQQCGIPTTRNLRTYLGVKLIHGKIPRNQYNFIVDRMKSKLASWKANSLSLAGRTVLVKSVLLSVPVYNMQSQLLPVHICSSIDKINRDFLWGSTDEQRKTHLLNWDTINLPRDKCGLNIRTARENNLAILSKLGWKIVNNDKAPWCQALSLKYLKKRTFWDSKNSTQASCTWKGILKTRKLLQGSLNWSIGCGMQTNFWTNP